MRLRVIDFETTGLPPEAGIVEIGWTDVIYNAQTKEGEITGHDITVGTKRSELVNPGRAIETAAKAEHHIDDSELTGKRRPIEVLTELLPGTDYFVAHQSKFEKQFFDTGGIPWICTLKAAYRLCPKAPNHKNQTIRYYLKTPVDKIEALPAHRAGPDSYVTAHTLAKFLTIRSPETLAIWETEHVQFPYCPIGAKERGKPWSEVDMSFLQWIVRTATMEVEIKANAQREINRRRNSFTNE
jgi:exodeoxyribonuclease X